MAPEVGKGDSLVIILAGAPGLAAGDSKLEPCGRGGVCDGQEVPPPFQEASRHSGGNNNPADKAALWAPTGDKTKGLQLQQLFAAPPPPPPLPPLLSSPLSPFSFLTVFLYYI